MHPTGTESIRRVGTGLSMILAWLMFAIGFALHPAQSASGAEQLRVIVANSGRWDLAHVLILTSLVLFIPAVLGLMVFLQRRGAWLGLIGGAFVVIGVVFFAAWVGAEGFASSALAGLPANRHAALAPAMHAIVVPGGTLSFVATTSLLLIAGWLVLAIGLFAARTVPRWMSATMVAGVLLLVGSVLATPQIGTLGAAALAVGVGGIGLQVLTGAHEEGEAIPV
jgi:hypothetical protein